MKINKLIKEGEGLLLNHNKHLSKYLARYHLNYTEEEIALNKDVSKENINKFRRAVNALNKGKLVQHITKEQSFYGYNFFVNKHVLIPRPETEQLVSETIKLIKKHFKEVAIIDLCTGSGCIAISMEKQLKKKAKIIYGVDISKKAIKIAKKNASMLKSNCTFFVSDMLDVVIKKKIKIDVLISNPPYLCKSDDISKEVTKEEPHIALFSGVTGLEHYMEILKKGNRVLNNKCLIALEVPEERAEEILELAKKEYYDAKTYIKKDLTNRKRMIFILRK